MKQTLFKITMIIIISLPVWAIVFLLMLNAKLNSEVNHTVNLNTTSFGSKNDPSVIDYYQHPYIGFHQSAHAKTGMYTIAIGHPVSGGSLNGSNNVGFCYPATKK